MRFDSYARAVSRDLHKMKAFVRFRAVEDDDGNGPRYIAWFEPDHHIVEHVSGFFRRRFGGMRWSILTPDRCVHWEGEGQGSGEVWFTPGVDPDAAPREDAYEDAWRLYYRSIFNPARLKVRAMLSEMPQKYWKNLPEARLIPGLVLAANERVAGMQATVKPADELRCGPRPPGVEELAGRRLAQAGEGTLEQLALQAAACRRCPLWEPATQTVWGEGPADARIMLVGEQPGDQEDLQGRPFVGPAGQLLDRALAQAGLDRRLLYLTNTVKHFKFKSRGKRRLHEKPLDPEILACVPWLEAEITRVKPALIVCLGATAARARLGRAVRINHERGRLLQGSPSLLLTFHPSYLLRLPDPAAAADAFEKLVADLRLAASTVAGMTAAPVAPA
jgi:DNA polymerase